MEREMLGGAARKRKERIEKRLCEFERMIGIRKNTRSTRSTLERIEKSDSSMLKRERLEVANKNAK